MRKNYQGTAGKSKGKFEVVGERPLAVGLPLPLMEVWEELQPAVEQVLHGRRIDRSSAGKPGAAPDLEQASEYYREALTLATTLGMQPLATVLASSLPSPR